MQGSMTRRVTTASTVALLALLLIATSAQAAVQWLTPVSVGAKTTTSCRFPDVCDTDIEMDSAGTTYLAVVNFDGTTSFRRVHVFVRPPGGSFGPPSLRERWRRCSRSRRTRSC